MKTTVVIPHHLPTLEFLNEWKAEFANSDVEVIIVNDRSENKLTEWPEWDHNGKISIYTHDDIEKEFGDYDWVIPSGTSACRSFGLYKAWQQKPDMIVTLDNDCFPDSEMPYYLRRHWELLNTENTLDWVVSTPPGFMDDLYPRGFPYGVRNKAKTYVNHGLWSKIPDLDAASMLLFPNHRTEPAHRSIVIPRHNFYPMCGMNLAFRPEATPLMYFGLFGTKYGFDQFDDIWAGVFSKKVMDHLGWAVRSGYPSVEHRKQSNVFVNFKKQAGGLEWNEELWKKVQQIHLTKDTPVACYRELIANLEMSGKYWDKVKRATNFWLDLFI